MTFSKGAVTQRPVSPRDIVDIQKEFAAKSLRSHHDTETSLPTPKEQHEEGLMSKATWRNGKHRHWKKNRRQNGGWNRGHVNSSSSTTFRTQDIGNAAMTYETEIFEKIKQLETVDTSSVSTESSFDNVSYPQMAFPGPDNLWMCGAPPPAMSFRIFPVAIPMEAMFHESNPNMFHVQFGSPNELVSVYCWDGIPPAPKDSAMLCRLRQASASTSTRVMLLRCSSPSD